MQRQWNDIFLAVLVVLGLSAAASAQKAAAKPAAAPVATPGAAVVPLPSEETVTSFLRETFGYEPAVSWKIVNIQATPYGLAEVDVVLGSQGQQNYNRLFIAPDGSHALIGDVIPFGAQPFELARRALTAGAKGPSRGGATGPVTIVEFSDFQCPHCKDAQPAVEKMLAGNSNVKFVFQNFPLPSHDWAMKAASYADCIGRANSDAFWKFTNAVFAAQTDITASNADEKLTAIADAAGAKGADAATCAARPETQARVEKSVELGKSVGVSSTPTFFINGRSVSNLAGLPDEVLKKIIAFHAQENSAPPAK